MLTTNKSSFIGDIYSAIIVNEDTSLDPYNDNRVQIYIPTVHYDYADVYKEYLYDENKTDSQYFTVFPWAKIMISNLKNGDRVFGSYIGGQDNQYIVLGLEGGEQSASAYGSGSIGTQAITGSVLLDYTMPIILHNEIGIALTAWQEDSIPNEKYSTITLHDGGTFHSSSGTWDPQRKLVNWFNTMVWYKSLRCLLSNMYT